MAKGGKKGTFRFGVKPSACSAGGAQTTKSRVRTRLCNRDGRPISRRNASRRFDLTIAKATANCLSLRGRKITLHT
jgi:hypothetical protein